jgi:hypothetical protein
MLSLETVWLPAQERQSCLAIQGICQVASFFLALDTGHIITWHQWVVLPMPPAVIARVNLLGRAEPSILTFTDRHGRKIGDYPWEPKPVEDDDDDQVME